MNHRDLALAAMRGEPVDHVPFIARMDLWYGYQQQHGLLPAQYGKASLWDFQRDIGVGIFGHGVDCPPFYRVEYRGAEITRDTTDGYTITRFATPHGTLTCRDRMTAELQGAATTEARTEFAFKGPEDYDALQYLLDHARIVEDLDTCGRYVASIGTDGLAVPSVRRLPAQELMLTWMGYERFYLELHDNPAKVDALLASLAEQLHQTLDLAVKCDAIALQFGGNYDEMMTPPPIFERFFAPHYRDIRARLTPAGKILVTHGDGEMRRLLQQLMDCGVQVVEALTPKPMTSIDIAQTRALWGDRVTMWGGVATVILTDVFSDAEFETFLHALFRAVAPGDHFILGFGDNVPTDAPYERVRRVVDFWAAHGRYPLAG